MDPEVEARFARSETSFKLRMDRAQERMDKAQKREDARWKETQERWKKTEEWGAKFDKRLEATRKLVETGIKMVVRMNSRLDEMAKDQKLILKTLQGGRNGHGSN